MDPTTNPFTYPKRAQDFYHLLDSSYVDQPLSDRAGNMREFLAHLEDRDIALEDFLSTIGSRPSCQFYFSATGLTLTAAHAVTFATTPQWNHSAHYASNPIAWDAGGFGVFASLGSPATSILISPGTYMISFVVSILPFLGGVGAGAAISCAGRADLLGGGTGIATGYLTTSFTNNDPPNIGAVQQCVFPSFLYALDSNTATLAMNVSWDCTAALRATVAQYDYYGVLTLTYLNGIAAP